MTWSWEKTREPTVTSSTSSCGRHRRGGGDRSTASILSAGIQTSQPFTIKQGHTDPPHQLAPNLQHISAVKETHERVSVPTPTSAPALGPSGSRRNDTRAPDRSGGGGLRPDCTSRPSPLSASGAGERAPALMPALQNTESRSSLGPRPAQTPTGDSQLRGPLPLLPKGGGRHMPSVPSGLGCFQSLTPTGSGWPDTEI